MDAVQRILGAASVSGSETPFAKLLLAVFNSILEVFLLCAAGYILARNGILDKRTQKQINRLNVSLFTPALLFSKVAFYLTPEKLRELWIVPVWFVIVTTASMFVGRVLGWTFRLKQSQRSFVMAAAMFMNSNALPIALMQSLVLSVPDLAWGDDDNTNAMMGRALTYLTMYSTLGMVVRYSYGVSLLSRADTINLDLEPQGGPTAITAFHESDERTPLLGSSSRPATPPPLIDVQAEADVDVEEGEGERGETLHTHPSSSTLYEPYSDSDPHSHGHEHEHDPSTAFSSKSKYTDSPGTMGSAVPLPVLLPSSTTTTSPNLTANANANGGASAPAFMRRPASKRVNTNTNTSFYNSFPNSPNESRANLPEWVESPDSSIESGRSESGSEAADEDEDEVLQGPCTATTAEDAERDLEAGQGRSAQPRHHRRHHHHHHHSSHREPSTAPSRPSHRLSLSHTLHILTHTLHRTLITLTNFMTVPLWAALASLLVACLEPLKHALENHLQPLNEALAGCGRCAVPLTLVVLGAYFYEGKEEGVGEGVGVDATLTLIGARKREKSGFLSRMRDRLLRFTDFVKKRKSKSLWRTTQANASRLGESKTVVLAILARMVLTPLLLVPLILVATMGDWHAVFEDPVFVTVNTILLCSPPALTLAQITAKVSGDAFERLISRTIFWSYCVLTPPVMIGCVVWGLWVAEF